MSDWLHLVLTCEGSLTYVCIMCLPSLCMSLLMCRLDEANVVTLMLGEVRVHCPNQAAVDTF